MSRYEDGKRWHDPDPIGEELYDRFASWLEGPVNDRTERLMKSRVLLAPLALGWTVWTRSFIALRDRKIGRLFKKQDASEVKARVL